jgi:hypothetical protein
VIPLRRGLIAIAVAIYLYFFLPATATLFYELYHLTHIDAVYWGYSGFKAAGYYFGIYEYRLPVCALVALTIAIIPGIVKKLRGN